MGNQVDVYPDGKNPNVFYLKPRLGVWTGCDFNDKDGSRLFAFDISPSPYTRGQWMNTILNMTDFVRDQGSFPCVSTEVNGFTRHVSDDQSSEASTEADSAL